MSSKHTAAGAGAIAIVALAMAASASAATNLEQKPGPAGCVTETSLSGQCEDGRGLVGPRALALSPDEENVYVAEEAWDSVASLTRNPADGSVTPISSPAGCLSSTASVYHDCTVARALGGKNGGAHDVAVSPDGENAYVVATDQDAVAVLDRDPGDGHLTQSSGDDGCVNLTGTGCLAGHALEHPTSVMVSPDGKFVYVGSEGLVGGIAVFKRDLDTGDLGQEPGAAGCVTESGDGGCANGLTEMLGLEAMTMSPDGETLYGMSPARDAVTLYSRDATTGALTPMAAPDGCLVSKAVDGCTVATGLGEPRALTFSADGQNAYIASERRDAILVFDHDGSTGMLTQKPGTAGCVSNTGWSDPMQAGTSGDCVNGVAMDGINSIAVLPDGTALYATAGESDGVVVFERAPDGTIAQRPGKDGCITETGFEVAELPFTEGVCADGRALLATNGIVASGDSKHVYATAREGGLSTFDVVPPPAPEQPVAIPAPVLKTVTPACANARSKARAIASKLKALARENERRARKATFVTSEAAKERLNRAASRGRRRAKQIRVKLRKANAAVRRLCV